ncbi:MAG: Hpt domain-containing protein [Halioglobus sp.]|nr:Hpt domain-containing protein [Halioglobus sp.]
MASKTDIVSLKWVIGLMNKQAENAEAALVEYGNDLGNKKPILRCMWAVHQITSTLRALGMKKGEMLTLEMERSLNYLYKDKVTGERRKLTMGGLMQALKVIPAYLAHTQNVRMDTGRGLEQYVNDLRRWVGERPRPQAFFFHIDIDPQAGISAGASPASDEEIKSRANVMLALYLEMAKQALRRRNVGESMKTVARVARKMQVLFAGAPTERFWFAMVGLCEGIAGGLIVPDECIAQIFKAGAFSIKYAREHGARIDEAIDYDSYLQQMLYYVACCKSRPVHIAGVRNTFGIDDDTIDASSRGLIHIDALVTALSGALEQLNRVVDYVNAHDLTALDQASDAPECTALDAIDAAQYRLVAAGQVTHADALKQVYVQLEALYRGDYQGNTHKLQSVVNEIIRGIVDVKLDLEHKLEHGLCSSFSSREFELRESVTNATFTQMALVENYLHQILRRKALKSALEKKPLGPESVLRLTLALHRHLNKSDRGHEELRRAVRDADNGEPDIDLLYSLARDFLDQLEDMPDRKAISLSLQLLTEIAGALSFAGMEREGAIIEQCHKWLSAASKAGSVREDDAFRCFADAFAQIEMHLQRSVIDPLDDTSHMLAFAEQRAAELDDWIAELSAGADVVAAAPATSGARHEAHPVQDADIPVQFREVFIEESEEIVAELVRLASIWESEPEANQVLRDIRRHFHTFKGNGRAVGANILGELGWAAQDMLDRVLDGELAPTDEVQNLVHEVVAALPGLVMSYRRADGLDIEHTRQLTNRCFALASAGAEDLARELPAADIALARPGAGATQTETLSH